MPVKLAGVAFAVSVQVEPLCVIVTDLVAIPMVVLRALKLFGGAYIVIEPAPVPVAGIGEETLSHGATGTAVQEHPEGREILIFRMPPFKSNAYDKGLRIGSSQDPGSWLIIKVAAAT